ncbi:MAG: hypothetical protein LQ350_005674 [Teloschistes chrysophthalmus]|nr:MAG: hypothetical protein LQ350_005674 [Niorma chrysophthalma]
MIGGLLFSFWRVFQIVTLIPTLGMLVSPSRTTYWSNTYTRAGLFCPPIRKAGASHTELCPVRNPRKLHQSISKLTGSLSVLFIVSVLAAAWAIATFVRRKSTRESSLFASFIDLCFVGAFIAGVYELRSIANASCSNFSADSHFSLTVDNSGVSGSSPFHLNVNKNCAMLKASFAFGIMNCIFFAITAFLLLFMHRNRDDREVVTKETYRRRSHDSR